MQSVREIRLVCLSNMARRFMDGLIYDLLHKPIVKHEYEFLPDYLILHSTPHPHFFATLSFCFILINLILG